MNIFWYGIVILLLLASVPDGEAKKKKKKGKDDKGGGLPKRLDFVETIGRTGGLGLPNIQQIIPPWVTTKATDRVTKSRSVPTQPSPVFKRIERPTVGGRSLDIPLPPQRDPPRNMPILSSPGPTKTISTHVPTPPKPHIQRDFPLLTPAKSNPLLILKTTQSSSDISTALSISQTSQQKELETIRSRSESSTSVELDLRSEQTTNQALTVSTLTPTTRNAFIDRSKEEFLGLYVCENWKGENRPTSRLCGYPAFYDKNVCASLFCSNTELSRCENGAGMIAFSVSVIILGLVIVLGNCLLPLVVIRRKDMRNQHNYIKVSLAVADMLTGFIILCSAVPYVFWLRNKSEVEALSALDSMHNSAIAVVAGTTLVISSVGSLLHLSFLTVERFITIQRSMTRNPVKGRVIGCILAGIWVLSIVLSFIPAMSPDYFSFDFMPVIFIYMIIPKPLQDGTFGYQAPLYWGLVVLLPYTVMAIFSLATAAMVWRKLRHTRGTMSDISDSSSSPRTSARPAISMCHIITKIPRLSTELAVFKTILMMIAAFSITLLPVVIISIMFVLGRYECDTYSLAYTLCFYLGLSNSFVNVIIYTVRDVKFRKALMAELSNSMPKIFQKSIMESPRMDINSASSGSY